YHDPSRRAKEMAKQAVLGKGWRFNTKFDSWLIRKGPSRELTCAYERVRLVDAFLQNRIRQFTKLRVYVHRGHFTVMTQIRTNSLQLKTSYLNTWTCRRIVPMIDDPHQQLKLECVPWTLLFNNH